jgi:hypothetical protein
MSDANTFPSKVLSLEELEAIWTLNRSDRASNNGMKVRSIDGESKSLRGGDFVLNEKGAATTLSVCFEHNGARYGLTAGHLAATTGQSIYAFYKDDPDFEEDENGGVPNMVYQVVKIGEVTSKSCKTDSLVFKIQDDDMKVDLLKLSPKAGLKGELVLPEPGLDPTPPSAGTLLVGYGAQRRGCIAKVSTPAISVAGQYSLVGDIGVMSRGDNPVKLTDYGDCGMLLLDSQSGSPVYFHHVFSPHTMESTGVPFLKVMACHSELGGTSVEEEEHQIAGFARTPSVHMSGDEAYDITHFMIKIVWIQEQVYDMAQLGVKNVRMVTKK